MSVHAEWYDASSCGAELVEAGTLIAMNKVERTALVIGQDGDVSVIEGTPAELRAFLERCAQLIGATLDDMVPDGEPGGCWL
jgi:hypothetical protein